MRLPRLVERWRPGDRWKGARVKRVPSDAALLRWTGLAKVLLRRRRHRNAVSERVSLFRMCIQWDGDRLVGDTWRVAMTVKGYGKAPEEETNP